MTTGIEGRVGHPMISLEGPGTKSDVSKSERGCLNGNQVLVVSGEQGENANANLAGKKEGFLSALVAQGWRVINIPVTTLLSAVTSAWHFVTTLNTTHGGSTLEEHELTWENLRAEMAEEQARQAKFASEP